MEGVESEYPTESAERLFADNVKYNTLLAKCKTKVNKNLPPRLKEEVLSPSGLTPMEVCQQLEVKGIKLTDRTLRNYVKESKIDAPYVKVLGRSRGKVRCIRIMLLTKFYYSKKRGWIDDTKRSRELLGSL